MWEEQGAGVIKEGWKDGGSMCSGRHWGPGVGATSANRPQGTKNAAGTQALVANPSWGRECCPAYRFTS